MIKAVNEAPKGFKNPGYEKVRTTMLSAEKLDLEAKLSLIRNSWHISGVSIISDEWKDQKNRPLINVITQSPKGAMFLKTVDCEEQMKDSQFIADILIEAIELVGPENVVQVITDNATMCRAAGLIIEGKYQHIFWTPCVVHSLNLMLSKMEKQIEWIRVIFEEAKEIQAFFTNHHMSQGIYREFAKLELLKVAETRFASHILNKAYASEKFITMNGMRFGSLWNQWRQSQSDKAQTVKKLHVDDEWWDKVEYLLAFTKPIVDLLRMFDTNMPNLGEVYEDIDSMIEKIRMLSDPEKTAPSKDLKVSQGFKKGF